MHEGVPGYCMPFEWSMQHAKKVYLKSISMTGARQKRITSVMQLDFLPDYMCSM